MQVILLNQCFYPEHVATSKYMTNVALELAQRGHQVSVVCSRRAYDDPKRIFPADEDWKGIHIHRVWNSGLGKGALWRRLCDFVTFGMSTTFKLLLLPKQDKIICLTTPPLISVLAAVIGLVKGSAVINWVMDLNPDEAIAMGILAPMGWKSRLLTSLQRLAFGNSSLIIALDRFMAQRIKTKYLLGPTVHTEALWTHDELLHYEEAARLRFREKHYLAGKFVVMYSGNHSPCHPLDAVLESARLLQAEHPQVQFLFIGGGVKFRGVREFAECHHLKNISWLPYQPESELSGSLSSADLHLVVMGDPFVGIVHPCKIYNILAVGKPFLFIGPSPCHITDLMSGAALPQDYARHAQNGDVEEIIRQIRQALQMGELPPDASLQKLAFQHTRDIVCPRLVDVIETR